jgi:hypothetical protein
MLFIAESKAETSALATQMRGVFPACERRVKLRRLAIGSSSTVTECEAA